MNESDRRVVQVNYQEGSRVASTGARAYVIMGNPGGDNDRIRILVRSRSGRWVDKWESGKRLTNPRVKTLPPEHPRYGDERLWDYDPDELAARLNRSWGTKA